MVADLGNRLSGSGPLHFNSIPDSKKINPQTIGKKTKKAPVWFEKILRAREDVILGSTHHIIDAGSLNIENEVNPEYPVNNTVAARVSNANCKIIKPGQVIRKTLEAALFHLKAISIVFFR